MFEDNGYEIKILNTINFKKSMKYNPFAYIRSEKDILKLVQTIIANTKGEGEKAGEDFWVKAEKLYYTALIGYIFYEAPKEEKNFATLLDMIDASEVRDDDETYLSEKFNITKHKNYKHLEDFDKKNAFDIEEYMKRQGRVRLVSNTMIRKI
jgi:traG/traD family protein